MAKLEDAATLQVGQSCGFKSRHGHHYNSRPPLCTHFCKRGSFVFSGMSMKPEEALNKMVDKVLAYKKPKQAKKKQKRSKRSVSRK